MAEQAQDEQGEAQEARASRMGMLLSLVAVVVVVMLVEGVIMFVFFKKPTPRTETPVAGVFQDEGKKGENDLMAPSILVKDIITSVRVDTSGNKLRNMIITLSIKLGRNQETPEGELDVGLLEKYKPKVEEFIPQFKHMLLEELSTHDYGELQRMSAWTEILDELKNESNKKLQEYGLEPRIANIYVQTMSFD